MPNLIAISPPLCFFTAALFCIHQARSRGYYTSSSFAVNTFLTDSYKLDRCAKIHPFTPEINIALALLILNIMLNYVIKFDSAFFGFQPLELNDIGRIKALIRRNI